MPSSSNAATRPCICTEPVVGWVVPVISLSKVLLPAPLTPRMPTDSPSVTLNEMSLSTQVKVWRGAVPGLAHSSRRPNRDGYRLYAFPKPATVIRFM